MKNRNVSVEVKTGKVSVYTRKDQERAKQNLYKESVGVVLTPNQKVDYSTQEERLLKSIVEQPVALINLPLTDFILMKSLFQMLFPYWRECMALL